MKLAEIRELDGPNLFLAAPAVKIEFVFENEADVARSRQRAETRLRAAGVPLPAEIGILQELLSAALAQLAEHNAQLAPKTVWKTLDTPGHIVFAFAWTSRAFARFAAHALVDLLQGEPDEPWPCGESFTPGGADDGPLLIRDGERRAKIVAITGTNSKTTTTRLVAHMAMSAGLHAGWSSSSGVYIDGAEVFEGDYSGPSGARRVLEDPIVDVAVLESARGGILLRGLAFEHCDVSVFTNVSPDHLGLQGINTIESLANVKAVVTKTTRPQGVAVLNADDKQVMRATAPIQVRKLLISQQDANPLVGSHLAAGGDAIVARDGDFVWLSGERHTTILPIAEAPVTFDGHARHMVENALCAIGAGIGLGLTPDQIGAALRTFRNSPEQNLGRLNVFTVDGVTVVMDFAHNSAGLAHLLTFARGMAPPPARVLSVIGTAGDRESSVLQEIGRIAGAQSDQVIIKKTGKYLRGRTHREMVELFEKGILQTPAAPKPLRAESELKGMELALSQAEPGDAIAIMCHEQMDDVLARLNAIGIPRAT
jgi:cyanophycin synthetase